VKLLT
jgi:hypothetical protein